MEICKPYKDPKEKLWVLKCAFCKQIILRGNSVDNKTSFLNKMKKFVKRVRDSNLFCCRECYGKEYGMYEKGDRGGTG